MATVSHLNRRVRMDSSQHRIKKLVRVIIGMTLFVAGYHHTHRYPQYTATQPALTDNTTYVTTPPPAHLKTSVAFRFIKPL